MNVGILGVKRSRVAVDVGPGGDGTVSHSSVLQVVEIGELGALGHLPCRLLRERIFEIVLQHLAAARVVAADDVLVQHIVVAREREPQLVPKHGTGQPPTGIEDIPDVRRRLEIRIGRQHDRRHRRQQLRPQRGGQVVGVQ